MMKLVLFTTKLSSICSSVFGDTTFGINFFRWQKCLSRVIDVNLLSFLEQSLADLRREGTLFPTVTFSTSGTPQIELISHSGKNSIIFQSGGMEPGRRSLSIVKFDLGFAMQDQNVFSIVEWHMIDFCLKNTLSYIYQLRCHWNTAIKITIYSNILKPSIFTLSNYHWTIFKNSKIINFSIMYEQQSLN